MTNYYCHRCEATFDDFNSLSAHWKKTVPCDYVCTKCGNRMPSRTTYYDHLKSNCSYVPKKGNPESLNMIKNKKTEKSIAKKIRNNTKTNNSTINNINSPTNCNNTNTNNTNYINININNLTINPHTKEMKIDKEELLGDIVEKILFRMDTGVSGKANWGTMAFTDSFHQMFAHIYGNKMKPENQNLFLKDEKTRELQIFNGKAFVDDKLTSEERMLKVLHFIGDGLRWMVENCDNYSPDEKQAKSEKIGRVLTGIPRFKLTYKAMFDNIFNTLKDVREQILERTQSEEMAQIES